MYPISVPAPWNTVLGFFLLRIHSAVHAKATFCFLPIRFLGACKCHASELFPTLLLARADSAGGRFTDARMWVGGYCVTLLKPVGLGKGRRGTWRLYRGDCREVLPGGGDGRVEVVELIE